MVIDLSQQNISMNCILNKKYLKAGEIEEIFLAIDIVPQSIGFSPVLANPVNICIVLDTSGSMADEEKLEQAKLAAIQFINSLGPYDPVSFISFAGKAKIHIEATRRDSLGYVDNIIRDLKADGTTNLYKAIENAFSVTVKGSSLQPDAINRILLLTDGQPTVGKSKPSDFISLSQQIQSNGISIITIGLGSDYNEDLLSLIASHSNGVWYHIRDSREIAQIFQDQFREMKTVLLARPNLIFRLMSGAEISEIYKIRPMLNKIEDAYRGGSTYEVSLTDVVGGKEQNIIFKISLPARAVGHYRIAKVELKSGSQTYTHDVIVEYTDDQSLYLKEANPYPRLLMQSSESTVLLREGISVGDETIIREAQTKLGRVLADQDAQTVVRENPLLKDVVTAFNSAYQETVVRGHRFKPDELKDAKSKITTIKKQ